MGRWREVVRKEISNLVSETGEDFFTRRDLIRRGLERFRKEFPAAKTPEQTLSRELQELRNLGEIEFAAPGEYRILVRGAREVRALKSAPSQPIPLPGSRRMALRMIASRPFQARLRAKVIPNFSFSCAICGLTPEWFLDAAHLRPAAKFVELAGDPAGAIALCKNHHQAMDVGAVIIETDLSVKVEKDIFESVSDETRRTVMQYDGIRIRAPVKFSLNPLALPSVSVR